MKILLHPRNEKISQAKPTRDFLSTEMLLTGKTAQIFLAIQCMFIAKLLL